MQRASAERLAVIEIERPEFCITQPHRVRQHCLEYRLQLAGRRADDPQHIGRRGLLLQRSQIVVLRSSLSRRVFSMAMTAWAAKFWTSSICFSVNGRTSWR